MRINPDIVLLIRVLLIISSHSQPNYREVQVAASHQSVPQSASCWRRRCGRYRPAGMRINPDITPLIRAVFIPL